MTYELNGVSRLEPSSLNGIEELENFEPWEVAQALREMGYAPENYSANPQNGIFSAIAGLIKGTVGGVKKIVARVKENQANRKLVANLQQQQQAIAPAPYQMATPYSGQMMPQQQQMFGGAQVRTTGGMTDQQKKYLMYGGGALALGTVIYFATRKKKGRR